MKTFILSSLFFLYAIGFAQEAPCTKGDCQNGYGFYYNKATGDVYHGFYQNGLYNGVGYSQNKASDYYYSNFKEGKPNGFTVYDEGEGRTSGLFDKGIKIGDHIREVRSPQGFSRELISYDQGQVLSRKTFTPQDIADATCISGDCINGYGIYFQNNTIISGKFEGGRFTYGEMMHIQTKTSDFFMPPVETEQQTPYFKFSITMTDNGANEAAYISVGPKADGQYILVNMKQNNFVGALFKDNQLVERY